MLSLHSQLQYCLHTPHLTSKVIATVNSLFHHEFDEYLLGLQPVVLRCQSWHTSGSGCWYCRWYLTSCTPT